MPKVCLNGLAVAALLCFLPCNRAMAQPAYVYAVDAYLQETDGVDQYVVRQARAMAGKMFATAGVLVRWRFGKPAPDHAITSDGCPEKASAEVIVRLTSSDPASSHPGAFAYAAPMAARVTVFYDRVRLATLDWAPMHQPILLAHVLVHEITHVIHGSEAQHSAEGLMKAQWSKDDLTRMQIKPLPFTPEDVLLMRAEADLGACESQTASAGRSSQSGNE